MRRRPEKGRWRDPLRDRFVSRHVLSILVLIALVTLWPAAGWTVEALKPISVIPDQDRIEVTALGLIFDGRGDILQFDTAPGADGIICRMSVRASTPGTNPSWAVFALQNATDKPIERWLTAERYTVVGSGIIWPDLDARRIEAVTPSFGFLPERVKNDRADIFRITLEPGQTITYAAELASDRLPRIYLWKPLDYELKARDRQLFNGIMLGITGLLGVFLTAVFAANHKAIFPSAALVAWCVLAYFCVDFGFWHKLFQLRPEDNALYRAASEAAMGASLVIFLSTFLRVSLWHGFIRMLGGVWIAAQLALIAVAVIDPRLAATFARASFILIGGLGAAVTLFLAASGQDRALALVPTWLLLLVWIFGAAVTLMGRLSGDIFVSGLVAGLVLIVVLLGFTVTQFAFRSFEPLYGAAPTELQLRSLAIDGAAAAVWEWHARRDEIKVSPIIEATLGLTPGELSAKVDDFAKHLHPADRERFRLLLWSIQERNGGILRIYLRMRHADNSYRWFDLEAASVPNNDRRALRCVGLLRDVTETKRAQERLMHDAVHDSLTGLPNRELFLDRLGVAAARAKNEPAVRPTVLFIDIDKFKAANSSFGLVVGDSLLLTVARRLTRHLGPQDTLARVGGDQFAVLLIAAQDARELSMFAERVRRSLRSPIKISGKDVVLTGSTGIAVYDGSQPSPQDLLKEAEIAMYRAKRGGADRIEVFRPEMRNEPNDRVAVENELAKAIERKQISVLFQPIIYLPTEELAGFEALARWEHPRLGAIDPVVFVSAAEHGDLAIKLGTYVLARAANEAAHWHEELPRADNPLFVSVNVSSRQLLRKELIQEIRQILGQAGLPPSCLRLEISESLVMENPEHAVEVLEWLRSAGAGLALDEFGTGYSSLAYLQRFPFDTIKIDRGLVQSSTGDGQGSAIVRSIVALAHELGKKVVAEGIEESEDASLLRSLGCEFAQGFYYGEPMPEREVLQLLKVIRKSERKLQRRGFFRTKAASRRRSRREHAPVAAGPEIATPAAAGPSNVAPPPPSPGALADGVPKMLSAGMTLPGGGQKGDTTAGKSARQFAAKGAKAGLALLSRTIRPRGRQANSDAQAIPASASVLQAPAPTPLQPNGRGAARGAPNGQQPRPAQAGGPQPGAAPGRAGNGMQHPVPNAPARNGSDRQPTIIPASGVPPTRPMTQPPPPPSARQPSGPRPPSGPPPNGAAQAASHSGHPTVASRQNPPPLQGGPPQQRPTAAAPPSQPLQRPPGQAPQRPQTTAAAAPPAHSAPQFPGLPPAIQQSLARLAGVPITEIPTQPPTKPGPRPAEGPAPLGRKKPGKSLPR